VVEQIGDPLGVLDIGLAPRDGFQVLGIAHQLLGIAHQHLEMAFEHIKDGFPVAGCTLHGNMGHPQISAPPTQQQQVWRHRAKRPPLLVPLACGVEHDGTAHHRSLVDVKSCARLVHDIHCITPGREMGGRRDGCPSSGKSSLACYPMWVRQTVVLVGHPGSHWWSGSQREYQTDL
jgi:hypothetical protein